LAAELESDQIASAYKSGAWPPADWVEKSLLQSTERLRQLRRSLALSGALAALLAVVGLTAAVVLGKIHFSLPLDYGKCVSAAGAGLAAWGTFLQFRQPPRTFRGTLIHEVIHSRVVRLLAITGFTLALLGTLWWQ
jgi:hypothetical protein